MALILMHRISLRNASSISILSKPFRSIRQSSDSVPLKSYIVPPNQLAKALAEDASTPNSGSRIIPLCASWFMPNDPKGRTGQQVFREQRIPSARFFDLDAVKDLDSPYPHMLPTAEGFAQAMQDMGIRKDNVIVVYDSQELGIFSAPRVGWTFKVFGHTKVHILNNFRLWVRQGYPTESGDIAAVPEREGTYPVPDFQPNMVVKFAEMKQIAKDHGKDSEKIQVLDARSQGRWAGTEPEPRPGLPNGHIPGSISMPITELLHPVDKTLLPRDQLQKVFESKGIDPAQKIISSCGTGVTAAVVDAALNEAHFGNVDNRRLYDGSWT